MLVVFQRALPRQASTEGPLQVAGGLPANAAPIGLQAALGNAADLNPATPALTAGVAGHAAPASFQPPSSSAAVSPDAVVSSSGQQGQLQEQTRGSGASS